MNADQTIPSKKGLWAGYILSAIPILMLLMSASMKFIKPAGFEEGLVHLGWSEDKMFTIGVLEVAVTIVYLIPKTAVLGAILMTAYLGGAVATHVRVGDMVFIQVILGILVWLGLYLREPRLRSLVPVRK